MTKARSLIFRAGFYVDFKDNGDASSQGQCLLGLVYG